jgi:hypothetical protein
MSVFGPAALVAGFLAAGELVLHAAGLVHDVRGGLRAAGMAIFTGWAATTTALSLALTVGAAPTLNAALVVWTLVGLGAVAVSRFASRPVAHARPLRESHRGARVAAAAGAAVLVAYLLALLVRAWRPTGVLHPDAWKQWLPKADVLYFFGGLDTGTGGFTSQMNPDYPPLDATSKALGFHALGGAETLDLARLQWALDVSFLFAVAWILSPRVRPAILWPSLAMFALVPGFGSIVGSYLADEPLSILVAMAGLTALLWLVEDDKRYAVFCGLFLAAATLTKNEGLMLALVIVVALAATAEGRRRWRVLVALVAVPLAVHEVWKLWLTRHSVPPNSYYDLNNLVRPDFMLQRLERLDYGLTQLLAQLVATSRWLLLVPCTLALAVLVGRRLPGASIFVCTVVVLDVLGFATIYWVSRINLHFYVDNTVDRLPAFIAFFCGAAFPLLLGATAPASGGEPPRHPAPP